MSELARVMQKVLDPTEVGFTAKELRLIGVGWPPPKGWRKRILKDLNRSRKAKPWPSNEKGFLVRRTGTGRHHIFANGRALCRSVNNPRRYIFVIDKPDNALCSNCAGLYETDPENRR